MEGPKKLGLVPILNLIKEGNSPNSIAKKFDIPKQTINYYVGKLKKAGCIEKVGYGTWKYLRPYKEVPIRPKGTRIGQSWDFSKKQIRGHAFIWKIIFYDPIDWKRVMKHYKKTTLTFRKICNGKVYRTIYKNRKIWLTKEGMVIYEPLDFFGPSSFTVKGNAVFQMDLIVKSLLRILNVKAREYKFTTSREHYALIKNQLAKQYNDKKEKMIIRNEEGSVWLWIDHSKGEHELETVDPVINRQIQNMWNGNKKNGFKYLSVEHQKESIDKINNHDKTLNKSMQVLEGYAKQINLHLKVEKKQLINLKKQDKHFENQTELFKSILKALKSLEKKNE